MMRTVQGVQPDRGPRRDPAAPPKPTTARAQFDPKASLARDAVNGRPNGKFKQPKTLMQMAHYYLDCVAGPINRAGFGVHPIDGTPSLVAKIRLCNKYGSTAAGLALDAAKEQRRAWAWPSLSQIVNA